MTDFPIKKTEEGKLIKHRVLCIVLLSTVLTTVWEQMRYVSIGVGNEDITHMHNALLIKKDEIMTFEGKWFKLEIIHGTK